jgi:hypothetical protein
MWFRGGDSAGLGCESYQGVTRGRLDFGEAAADRARSNAALHFLRERTVAAGIEDHQAQSLRGADRLQDAVERNGLILDVEVAEQFGIGRDEKVDAVGLDSMAGIIDHRDVGIRGRHGEFAHGPPHLDGTEILAQRHDIEADLPEHLAHGGGIIVGIGQQRHVLVLRDSEHQRHPLVGERVRRHQQCQEDRQNQLPGQATPK